MFRIFKSSSRLALETCSTYIICHRENKYCSSKNENEKYSVEFLNRSVVMEKCESLSLISGSI